MASSVKLTMMFGLVQLSFLILLFSTTALTDKVHIVYMGKTHSHLPSHEVTALHHTMLASTLGSADLVQDSLVYSYTHAFTGFAAKLSPEHVAKLSQMEGVLSVLPNIAARPQTTHSWEFLGLSGLPDFTSTPNVWTQAKFGEDTIIGMVDTGIWPESESFKDDGLSDIPAKWKGACFEGQNFTTSNCNKKLIGAKWFSRAFEAEFGALNPEENLASARDTEGHGTHTAATAGGRFVANVSYKGFASGTAKGGAPSARIAVYKVCWKTPPNVKVGGCLFADIMAAMEEAVKDGVDLMSISIGGPPPPSLFQDGMGVAAFHAMQQGVLVVLAGGNSGPFPLTVDHLEPWSLTVGASSMDRTISATLELGDFVKLQGLTTTKYETLTADLVSADDLTPVGGNITAAGLCEPGSLDPAKTEGKIVFCLSGEIPRAQKGIVVKNAGGVGMILGKPPGTGNDIVGDDHVLPALAIAATNSEVVLAYIKNDSNPVATLHRAVTNYGMRPSPVVTGFSSVGPNLATPDVLKPDLIAPGLSILAAWSGASSPTDQPGDDRKIDYNIISGTSMAAPHVAGVAALLKAIHPDWSPAAIKSALMTTTGVLDNIHHRITNSFGEQASPFEAGAGHIDPNSAANPGLVYDASAADYTVFLCSLRYNDTQVEIITGQSKACSTVSQTGTSFPSPSDLNLPSLTVANLQGTRTIRREVTNVDPSGSRYKVFIVPPSGVSVSISPSTLKFNQAGEKKTFFVTLTPDELHAQDSYTFGSYTWYNGKRKVRSPIVVGFNEGSGSTGK